MTDQQLLFALAALAGLNLVLLIVVLVRQSGKSAADAIEALGKDLRTQREDAAAAARDLRAELANLVDQQRSALSHTPGTATGAVVPHSQPKRITAISKNGI